LAAAVIAVVGLPALSSVPVAAASNATPPATPRLSHWWPADGNATDMVAHDDGHLRSGVSYGPGGDGADQAWSFAGGADNAVVFNRRVGNFGTAPFTLSFEVQTTFTGFEQAVWDKRDVCHNGSFWEFRIVNGDMSFDIYDTPPNVNPSVTSTIAVNDGAWHQIVAIREGRRIHLYVDGTLEGSATTSNVLNLSNDVHMTAGVNVCDGVDATVPFQGELGELKIYSGVQPPVQAPALAS
jgi:hypothetical protein